MPPSRSLSHPAGGHVLISWLTQPGPRGDKLRLRWKEEGGPPVRPSFRKGFGSHLIEVLAQSCR